MKEGEHSRFEKARIIGARALQISMGAPVLVEVPPKTMNAIHIALKEYDAGLLPMTTDREQDELEADA